MFWFALGCTASGLVLGNFIGSALVLAITTFEMLAILFGLWMGGVLAGWDVLYWSISGAFLHQGAFLAGVVIASMREAKSEAAPSLAEKVDRDLVALDGLVGRMATGSLEARIDTEQLRDTIARMRRTLRDEDGFDNRRRESRRAIG